LVIFNRYSRSGLWLLFLTTAFPIHLWTIILVIRDFSWVAERTDAWDAVGVAAYGMVFAFVESVVVFIIIALLGLLLPKQWDERKRIAFLGMLVLIVALWAILGQLHFLLGINLPPGITRFLALSGHPLRWLYAGLLVLVSFTVIVPVYIFIRSEGVSGSIYNFLERLAVLSAIYLVFDVIGLIIVIIRNLT
jgi:hypothetical protein